MQILEEKEGKKEEIRGDGRWPNKRKVSGFSSIKSTLGRTSKNVGELLDKIK